MVRFLYLSFLILVNCGGGGGADVPVGKTLNSIWSDKNSIESIWDLSSIKDDGSISQVTLTINGSLHSRCDGYKEFGDLSGSGVVIMTNCKNPDDSPNGMSIGWEYRISDNIMEVDSFLGGGFNVTATYY